MEFSKLKETIEQNDTKAGRIFDLVIQLLIVLSLVTFSLETLPNLSERHQKCLRIAEILIIGIFSIEYLLRIIVSDQKLRFIFSFYGIIDLLAILPFYFSAVYDLRYIRILRLLRLIRAFKLVRYSQALQRFSRALAIAKEEILLFSFAALVLLYFSAVGIYYFERDVQPEAFASVFHSLWWAVATLTTVGYGDIYPVTAMGKVFTFFVLAIGLGIVAVPAGLVASALSKARETETSRKRPEKRKKS